MSKIVIQYTPEGSDEERDINLPALWVICHFCAGEGKSSAHLGAITQDDWEENWSEDEFADYIDGFYDKKCESCEGRGRVLEIDYNAKLSVEQRSALAQHEEVQSELAECNRIERWEREHGA